MVPRVMLLVGGMPGGRGGGARFLEQLCLHYPRGKLCRFSPVRDPDAAFEGKWMGFPFAHGAMPRDKGVEGLGYRWAQLTTLPIYWYLRNVRVPRLVEQAVAFGERECAELVWSVLNSATLIHMARKVAFRLGVPFVTTVWDPPERFFVDQAVDPLSRWLMLREFAAVLREATSVGVASEPMQVKYTSEYGIESVVMISGIDDATRCAPAKSLEGDGHLTIGVAGNIYAMTEWRALLAALDSVSWRLEGRDVVIRVLGEECCATAGGAARIEYLGWRSDTESVRIMSQVDVTYLPYWFDRRYEKSASLCHPAKLATYLAAGRPVLFHGPKGASPARFLSRYPAGVCCHSLSAGDIVECLRGIAFDSDAYAAAVRAGQMALDAELNLNVFLERFASLLGIDVKELS